jgi:hypothetical protein
MEEKIAGVCPLREFGRALAEFEVEMIYGKYAPQAEGQRLSQMLQDPLVKEMRLLGISSIQAAAVTDSPTFNGTHCINLQGGFDCIYGSISGVATVHGSNP